MFILAGGMLEISSLPSSFLFLLFNFILQGKWSEQTLYWFVFGEKRYLILIKHSYILKFKSETDCFFKSQNQTNTIPNREHLAISMVGAISKMSVLDICDHAITSHKRKTDKENKINIEEEVRQQFCMLSGIQSDFIISSSSKKIRLKSMRKVRATRL